MGGPLAGALLKCLLLEGPKLRLLAKFAKLESRSPVTSFPALFNVGPELDIGDIVETEAVLV